MKSLITLVSVSLLFIGGCSTNTQTSTPTAQPSGGNSSGGTVTFTQVRDVINQRCATCHSTTQTDSSFGPMPGGVVYDTPEQIKASANRIKARAVTDKTMPKGNKTNITDAERELLGKWVDQGAPIN